MDKVYIDSDKLREILRANFISIRSLGTKGRENYCGYDARSIGRALSRGYMTHGMYEAIEDVIDISDAVLLCPFGWNFVIAPEEFEKLKRIVDNLNEQMNAMTRSLSII